MPTLPGKYNEISTVPTARLIDSLVTLNRSIADGLECIPYL
jgi:hypothetical protein